jgi:acetyltransferase EpsM
LRNKLLILGAGCLARDVADLIEDIPDYRLEGFVVDQPPFERGQKLLGRPVYWIDELDDFDDSYRAVCSLGRMKKNKIIQRVKDIGIPFINLIHPSAHISKTAILGEGVFVGIGSQIGAESKIGNHVFINRGTLIGSGDEILDYSVISAGANIAGGVSIGPRTYVGIGAIILQHTTIGELCVIGAGSMVTRNLPDRVKAIGNPAEIIEKGIDGF